MRQPLWLLNSSLLILFVASLCLSLLLRQKPPRWVSIEPAAYIKLAKKEVSETEIAKIYENDLFGTYQKMTQAQKALSLEEQLPLPPVPQEAFIPGPEQPSFLEPLQATLRGIIVLGDDKKNRIILENDTTKQESNLKIGDKFEDAQLIMIFRDRAVFIRSNGQEETLYLTEKDAKLSPEGLGSERWEGIIKKTGTNSFSVDPELFAEYVTSLAQFIEELDLITVYRKGEPFGTRIGKIEQSSFGFEFGLELGDIIMSVNDIPATDMKQRLEIYKKITSLALGQNIIIKLLRHASEEIKVTIKLQTLGQTSVVTTNGVPRRPQAPAKTIEDIQEEKREIMEKKYQFAPTVNEIKKKEKQIILKKVKKKELEQKRDTSSKFEL